MKHPQYATHNSTSSPEQAPISYMPTIDGLRGGAILLVLWYHAPFLFRQLPEFANQQNPWASLGPFWAMSLGGWIGVDFFFVISGFLITLILIRVRSTSDSSFAFWARRALRILPLGSLYLLTLGGLAALGDPLHVVPNFDAWPWYAFYLGNIHIAINGWQPLAFMILWSLAIEEQFYLVWPFLVHVCNTRRLLLGSIGLIVLAPFMRASVFSIADYPASYVFTLCRLDALACGAAIAVLHSSTDTRDMLMASCKRFRVPALTIIVITLVAPFSPSFPQTRPWIFTVVGYSLLAVSFAVLLATSLATEGPIKQLLTSRILTFLGKRCYGLYLWHVLAAGLTTVILQRWEVGYYGHITLWLIILVAMASGSWFFFEEPILRLKRFVPYERSRGASLFPAFVSTIVRRYASPERAP